jgi:NAD(P)-dependent dehydrogenase (short-subunit alcohol dehydrogenase family)
MQNLYAGKIAAVTGGTSGVGEAIARALAREGAAGLTISGRNAEKGEAIAADLTTAGCPTLFVAADLEKPEECRSIVSGTVERFGRIDGVANSAANTARSNLLETTPEFFDSMMATNVRAPLIVMQEAVRDMRARKEPGSIVNILSINMYSGAADLCAYSTSKGALAALTRNIASAHKWDRIRCNGIVLGWTDTPHEHEIQRRAHNAPEDWLEKAESRAPMGKLAQPDELADLVVLIMSDRGGIMTGALIDYNQHVLASAG